MLPSWFTRLRDVKTGSRRTEQNKLCAASPSTNRCDKDPASFAKSWSLQRANGKAKSARIEADTTSACDDSRPSISGEVVPLRGTESACSLQVSELSKDAMALLMLPCSNLDSWDHDFISMSNCKSASRLQSSKEIKALVQKGHGVSDNDTEDFALTSETRSSFCSETSSADSSVSCKCGCEEKGNQDERYWQEGNDRIKSLGVLSENLQGSCAAGEQTESHRMEITAKLMSSYSQKSVRMRRDIWRGRGSFLFSYLTLRRRRSVAGNTESRSIFYESNAGRDGLSLVENCGNLIKKNVGKTSPRSSELETENFTSRKNLPSVNQNRSNVETLGQSLGKSNAAVEANLDLVLDNGDIYRCTSDIVEKSSVDPLAQNVWLEKRNEPHPSAIVSSTQCAPPESAEESKGRVFSMKRRRQRGASISAALPPDLQGVVGDSLALVKMSDDPYEDFRQSIYEMIMEKDLEGSMDVEELLYCYLTLNAPEHHELIEEVFSDVWSAILMTFR